MMNYRNQKNSFRRISLMVLVFLMLFLSIDLYADQTKTQLELNKDIFDQKTKSDRYMRRIDFVGNTLFIKPVS